MSNNDSPLHLPKSESVLSFKKIFRWTRSRGNKFLIAIRYVLMRGCSYWGRYYCPVCEHRIQSFLPLPSYFADNQKKHGWPYKFEQGETLNYQKYSCPICKANDRDRLYALYLQSYFVQIKSEKIIYMVDFAPSTPLSRFIRKRIAILKQKFLYRTADLFAINVDDKVDITNMEIYNDEMLDFFICSHVLEHVDDDRKALSEFYRVLKPGGQGILMVPIILGLDGIDEDPAIVDVFERWRRFGQFDHVRIYSREGFLKRVREAGFLIHQYDRDFFGEKLFDRMGISLQSVLYIVEKS